MLVYGFARDSMLSAVNAGTAAVQRRGAACGRYSCPAEEARELGMNLTQDGKAPAAQV